MECMDRGTHISVLMALAAAGLCAPASAATMVQVRTTSQASAIPAGQSCSDSPTKPVALKLTPKAAASEDSPVASFFAAAPQRVLSFLRSVVEAEAMAKTPPPQS